MIGVGVQESLKIPFGKRQGSIKFPVAPKSMRAVVLTVCFSPCSMIGRHKVLLFCGAMSTLSILREEDVEAASLLKNPMLSVFQGWILQLVPQMVLHNTFWEQRRCRRHSFQMFWVSWCTHWVWSEWKGVLVRWRRGSLGIVNVLWAIGGRTGVRGAAGGSIMASLPAMEAATFSDTFGSFSGGELR